MEQVHEDGPQGVEEESFDSFPEANQPQNAEETPLHELRLLMHVEGEDGHPLPAGEYTKRGVFHKLQRLTGVSPERVRRVNIFDTVIEVAAEVSITAIAQALHSVTNWEERPVSINCLMGTASFITNIVRQRNIIIEQQTELHHQQEENERLLREKQSEMDRLALIHQEELARQAERLKTDDLSQQHTLDDLVHRVDQQARMVHDLQLAQSSLESVPRISSSIITPQYHETQPRKMTRNPDLPNFSGELPTPKGEVEFDNWIFQVKNLRKTYTDDAIRNGVVSSVRGVANKVVRAVGYEATLVEIIECLDLKFGHGETEDKLLQEFHQLHQGASERVLDYGSNLECKFKVLQERFPMRYNESQLKDRFFSSVNNKTRDTIRHKYDLPDCTFSQLLTAAMRAEAETGVSHAVRAKAANAEPSSTNDMTSIQTQLTSMTEILKSAKFLGKGQKRKGEATAKSADARQGLQGPGTSAAGPFKKGRPPVQCHRCKGWGHFARNCASKVPAEGSVEWENMNGEAPREGGALPQKESSHPK